MSALVMAPDVASTQSATVILALPTGCRAVSFADDLAVDGTAVLPPQERAAPTGHVWWQALARARGGADGS